MIPLDGLSEKTGRALIASARLGGAGGEQRLRRSQPDFGLRSISAATIRATSTNITALAGSVLKVFTAEHEMNVPLVVRASMLTGERRAAKIDSRKRSRRLWATSHRTQESRSRRRRAFSSAEAPLSGRGRAQISAVGSSRLYSGAELRRSTPPPAPSGIRTIASIRDPADPGAWAAPVEALAQEYAVEKRTRRIWRPRPTERRSRTEENAAPPNAIEILESDVAKAAATFSRSRSSPARLSPVGHGCARIDEE